MAWVALSDRYNRLEDTREQRSVKMSYRNKGIEIVGIRLLTCIYGEG